MTKHRAEKRRLVIFEVPKEDLLRLLKEYQFSPDNASRIVASGHRPDCLTFTVGFD